MHGQEFQDMTIEIIGLFDVGQVTGMLKQAENHIGNRGSDTRCIVRFAQDIMASGGQHRGDRDVGIWRIVLCTEVALSGSQG